jgi:hypothetical protein
MATPASLANPPVHPTMTRTVPHRALDPEPRPPPTPRGETGQGRTTFRYPVEPTALVERADSEPADFRTRRASSTVATETAIITA